jgi:anti-anti-sigma regulatory factor
MLRIRRYQEDSLEILALSGRLRGENVAELQKLIEGEAGTGAQVLDLEEVRLVDREVVQFLAACEGRGIRLKKCPSYIREWIETGRL